MFETLLPDIDALFVTNPLNIRYLTGFVGLAPDERESYVIVTTSKIYLFTTALYIERANQFAFRNPHLVIIETSPITPLSSKIIQLSRELNIKIAGFESSDLTHAEFEKFTRELNLLTLLPTQNRIENMRIIKNLDEITKLKKAIQITDECFAKILTHLKSGVSESEIAWDIETYFRNNGAQSAFPPIVAFDVNASQPHYASSERYTLNANSLILLDFGAKFNGYCADMTRMAFLGYPNPEIEKAYEALKNAQQKALDLLKAGKRNGAHLDKATRDELAIASYPPYPHSLGHAVGLAIHEAPRLSIRQDEILKPGMVVSVEPGIYVEGKFGMRIEDLVLITDTGIEVLSKSPKNLTVL